VCADVSRLQLGGNLVDGFLGSSDSVFSFDFGVNVVFVCKRIHSSAMEALSLMVSESATTKLLVTISKSTATVCAD
jgi:hypothetical protein